MARPRRIRVVRSSQADWSGQKLSSSSSSFGFGGHRLGEFEPAPRLRSDSAPEVRRIGDKARQGQRGLRLAATHGGGLPIPAARKEAQAALSLTGLIPYAAKPAGALSLLNLKRLELAKAVAAKPKLLLLDEIAGGLTDAECDDLLKILSAIHAEGATIVWVEHVIHALKRIATRLAVLHFGAIICEGAPDAVLADERVREVYLGA